MDLNYFPILKYLEYSTNKLKEKNLQNYYLTHLAEQTA